jgi:phytanoyl-CoA hydroxylase
MATNFRDTLRPYKRAFEHILSGSPREFDPETLPWIDKPGADIDSFLKDFDTPLGYKYDLKEKLSFWRENGYVILEQAVPADWCDQLWNEFEYTLDNHKDFGLKAVVHGLNNHNDVLIKDVDRERLHGTGVRVNDYHQASIACKKMLSHRNIATFLKALFNEPVVAFQSLVFKYSSQQRAHQDFPWVTSGIASHLAAAWISLEDITLDSGPLFYYVGSHRMPKYNFGNGILYKEKESLRKPEDFETYLENKCAELGYPKEQLLLKKGDLLLWHAALVHGGMPITSTPPKTRKSLVVHYSTKTAYPTPARFGSYAPPVEYINNGISIYQHPQRPEEENILKMGESWQENIG